MNDISPDIMMLSEIGGVNALDIFNQRYLSSNYIPSIICGNSDRDIHLGFLIKKGLPYQFEHLTHRNRPLDFKYKNKEN